MEERSDGILLRRPGSAKPKLSWTDTGRAMAAEGEDWTAWESAAADGLEDLPWKRTRPQRVAEQESAYKPSRPTFGLAGEMPKSRQIRFARLVGRESEESLQR